MSSSLSSNPLFDARAVKEDKWRKILFWRLPSNPLFDTRAQRARRRSGVSLDERLARAWSSLLRRLRLAR